MIVIFAPGGRNTEDALVRTRWMAEQTLVQLTDAEMAAEPLLDSKAQRSQLEIALDKERSDVQGVALFAHGRVAEKRSPVLVDDAIIGADGQAAIDADNAALLHGRWAHAVACHSATELAALACDSGAVCFVGYGVTLIVEWNPREIPDAIKARMIDLVTATTMNLAGGVRGERNLKAAVNDIAEHIVAWCDSHPEQAEGLALEVTAQQFVNLVYCEARAGAESGPR